MSGENKKLDYKMLLGLKGLIVELGRGQKGAWRIDFVLVQIKDTK